MLLHSHPEITHGWSVDGINWEWSPDLVGPDDVPNAGDNERPRVVVDANGDVDVVYVSQEVGPGDASRLAAYTVRRR